MAQATGLSFHDLAQALYIINTDANLEGNRRYAERHKSREFLPIGVYYIDIKSVHLGRVRDGRKINKSFQLNV